MDEEGIDVAVLYPSLWLLYGDLYDPQLAAAACRAYDKWLADFCKPFSEAAVRRQRRCLFKTSIKPVREMRRVVRDLGFKALFVRPNPFNGRRLNDTAYDPFWREAQELERSGRGSRRFRDEDAHDGQRSLSRPFLLPHGLSSVRAASRLHGYHLQRSARTISKTHGRLPRNREWGLARLLA